MATEIESLSQYEQIQKTLNGQVKLILLFFYDPACAKCDRLNVKFDSWCEDEQYENSVRFLKCNKENSNEDIFKKFNIKILPTILFLKDDQEVEPAATKINTDGPAIIHKILNQ